MKISEIGIERRTGTPMRTPPEKRQQCLTTRLATHRIPQKPLTQTLASSPPRQVRFHQEVRGTASIYANNFGYVKIFYAISERLRPFGPVHSPIRQRSPGLLLADGDPLPHSRIQ